MKKHLLSFIVIFLSLPAIAQITVTHENLVGAGATVVLGLDTISQLLPGGGGANQTWDFTSVITQDHDTMWFMNPDETTFPDAFPTANLAIRIFLEDMYAYLENNTQGLYMIGTAWEEQFGQPDVVSTIVPGETIAAFPMNYLDNFSESFVQEIKVATPEPLSMDSLWVKIYTDKTTVIDAWGTITTPLGTFQALRERNNTATVDSIFAYMRGGWTLVEVENNIDEYYSWWSDDPATGYPVLELNVDTGTGLPDDIFFLVDIISPSLVEEPLPMHDAVVLSPNPCSGSFSIMTPDSRGKTQEARLEVQDLKIFDITGQEVNGYRVEGNDVRIINMPAGLYFVRIQAGDDNVMLKLVVSH